MFDRLLSGRVRAIFHKPLRAPQHPSDVLWGSLLAGQVPDDGWTAPARICLAQSRDSKRKATRRSGGRKLSHPSEHAARRNTVTPRPLNSALARS